MKGLIALSAVLLLGCADIKTLEELELTALQTGDWSAVNAREQSIARREARRGPSCPSGQIAVCEKQGRTDRCQCTSRDDLRDLFGSF